MQRKDVRLTPYRSALLVLLQLFAALVVAAPAGSLPGVPVPGPSAITAAKADAPGLNARLTPATQQGELPGHAPAELPPGLAQPGLAACGVPTCLAAHRAPATTGPGPLGGRAPPLPTGI